MMRIYTRERRFSPESPERTSASGGEALDMAADEIQDSRVHSEGPPLTKVFASLIFGGLETNMQRLRGMQALSVYGAKA